MIDKIIFDYFHNEIPGRLIKHKEAYEIIRDYFKCCRENELEYFDYLVKNKRLINVSDFSKFQRNIKGQYRLLRTDELSNYQSWIPISFFTLNGWISEN